MGYGVLGVLSWGSQVTPKFSAPLVAKLRRTPKVIEVQERARRPLSPCQVWLGSDFRRRRGGQKCWVFCLSVCLFVCSSRCWMSEFVRPISPWMRWSTETILMPLNGGICVCIRVQHWRSRKTSRSRPCKVSVSSCGVAEARQSFFLDNWLRTCCCGTIFFLLRLNVV